MYKIKTVDAGKLPVLYTLVDTMDGPIPGHYYRQQLIRTQAPKPGAFYKIERVVKTRTVQGRKEYLLKFLHYPPKFNRWVPRKNFLK